MSSSHNRNDNPGKEVVEALSTIADADTRIQEDLSQLSGRLDSRQNELLKNLIRLQQSLRGPERLLDQGSYSRPFPPHNRTLQQHTN